MALQSRLPEIAATLRPAVEEAAAAGAELIVNDAKGRVPVDTGRLRDAIHVEVNEDGVWVIAGDSKVFYGHIVEHGGARGHVPHPFLNPALEGQRAAVEELVAKAVHKVVG